ncbi:MAG: single-stranded DNA-binding protein [Acidimicrobiales bacterium]
MNTVLLQGVLSSEPRVRELPSGSMLVSWEVTTESDGVRLSVPVVWFDPPASGTEVHDGDEVVVLGEVRRRYFKTTTGTSSVTEVVVQKAAKATRARQAQAVLAAASDRLAG